MITKYLVTDASGREVYLETYDQDLALKHWYSRKKAMDCYLDEVEVCYEDLQYMTDEERLELYEAVTGEKLDEVNDEFWDWADEELD